MVIKVCYFYPTGLTNIIFETQNLEKEGKLDTRLWQANTSREKSRGPATHGKKNNVKKIFPATAEKWGVTLGGREKSCKYCFNKSLWLAYSSMCCRTNVSYSRLHTHWSEVIPLLSYSKGGKMGQEILHFTQQKKLLPMSTHTALCSFANESHCLCASQAHFWLLPNTLHPKDAWELEQTEMRRMAGQAPIQIPVSSPFAIVRGRLPRQPINLTL